jgi:hypothetical protein
MESTANKQNNAPDQHMKEEDQGINYLYHVSI